MTPSETHALIENFLAALGAADLDTMVACVSDDVIHDINQGGERRIGKDRFEAYTARMQHHYAETISDELIFVAADGARAAAEYNVTGKYVHTEDGLPPATDQVYTLPAGMFFAVGHGKITRITTYYNLTDWLTQIVKGAK